MANALIVRIQLVIIAMVLLALVAKNALLYNALLGFVHPAKTLLILNTALTIIALYLINAAHSLVLTTHVQHAHLSLMVLIAI